MSRITKALEMAEMQSIPFKRKEKFHEIIEQIKHKIKGNIKLSVLYNGDDEFYRLFISHLHRYISEDKEIALLSKSPERFSGNAELYDENNDKGDFILDNIYREDCYVLFLAEDSDFCFLHGASKERILGAIIIS